MDTHFCCSISNLVTGRFSGLHAAGSHAEPLVGDLTDETFIAKAVSLVKQRWGRADVLVNNAGISFIAPAETVEAAAFRRVLEVDLVAPFVLSRVFGSVMLEQREGSIVNVASMAGLVGVRDRPLITPRNVGSSGSPAPLRRTGRAGVRVNAACPGGVKTEMDIADQAG